MGSPRLQFSLRSGCSRRHLLFFAFLVVIFILAPAKCSAQKSEGWLPITAQDLEINSVPGEPDAAALCDEVVEPEAMDGALAARVKSLTDSGLVNAAANRHALRIGQEPLNAFRQYMSVYAIEQARCHLSPALVHNLERHWRSRDR